MRSVWLESVLVSNVSQSDGVAVLIVVRYCTLLDEGLMVFVTFVLDVTSFFGVYSVSGFITIIKKNLFTK